MSTLSTASGDSWDQISQPPNGAFIGTPSRVTSARPAPDGAMARRLMPWVVGLAAALPARRNRLTAGVAVGASSSRGTRVSSSTPSRTTEKAASPSAGGRRAAVTTISSRTTGGSAWIMPRDPVGSRALRQGVGDDVVADRRLHEVMSPGHDHQILPTVLLVDHGVGLPAGRQHVRPQGLAGLDVDGPDQVVGGR